MTIEIAVVEKSEDEKDGIRIQIKSTHISLRRIATFLQKAALDFQFKLFATTSVKFNYLFLENNVCRIRGV